MRHVALALTFAFLMVPALALAECGDGHQKAAPAVTTADKQPERAPACAGDAKVCADPQAKSERPAVASTTPAPRDGGAPRQ
jgi:hypothetical protein